MRTRFLLIGTLAAALAVFVWQTISNTVIPWHEATLREFTDPNLVREIRAAAPANGVYFAKEGVLAAVSFTPEMADRTQMMGPMLGRQVAIDIVVVLLVAIAVLHLPAASPRSIAWLLATLGFAATALTEFSNWNWYGFPSEYASVNVIDHTIQFFLAGWILGALRRRIVRDEPQRAADVGVRAGGGLPSPTAAADPIRSR
jgi:hypothetical protein